MHPILFSCHAAVHCCSLFVSRWNHHAWFQIVGCFTLPSCDYGMLASHKVHKPLLRCTGQLLCFNWCIPPWFLAMLQSIVAHFLCSGRIIMLFQLLGCFTFPSRDHGMLGTCNVDKPLLRWRGQLLCLTLLVHPTLVACHAAVHCYSLFVVILYFFAGSTHFTIFSQIQR